MGLTQQRYLKYHRIFPKPLVLTPPDIISQVLMAMPLYLLYEISVLISYVWYRREKREEEGLTPCCGLESGSQISLVELFWMNNPRDF